MVGTVKRDDIPISAVDSHVYYQLVPSLLMNDDIFTAANDAAEQPGSGCDDAEQAVKKVKQCVVIAAVGGDVAAVTGRCADGSEVEKAQVIWKYRSSLSEKQPIGTQQLPRQQTAEEHAVAHVIDSLWDRVAKPAQSISMAQLRRQFN